MRPEHEMSLALTGCGLCALMSMLVMPYDPGMTIVFVVCSLGSGGFFVERSAAFNP